MMTKCKICGLEVHLVESTVFAGEVFFKHPNGSTYSENPVPHNLIDNVEDVTWPTESGRA